MPAMALLRLMMTMKSAYTSAEAMESSTPMGLMVCEPSLCVMMSTPPKVAAMASHTGHEGTTFRNTMIMATRTG